MPTKQRINQNTAVPFVPDVAETTPAVPEDRTLHPWDYEPSSGPWDLYRQFAFHFIDQEGYLKGLDDDTYDKALAAVSIAVEITLRCASVDPTWTAYYQRITTPIKGGQA